MCKAGAMSMLVLASLLSTAAGAQTLPGPATCTGLVGLQVDTGVVTASERFAKGASIAPSTSGGAGSLFGGDATVTATANLCRVKLQLKPTASSLINVEVWLPETWNGKMFGYGGGGLSGGLGQSATLMNTSAGKGYASATSDLGHTASTTAEWAGGQPEKIIDWGHRAGHLSAVTSKQVMNAYYQAPVQRAYFQGCSGGGREALMSVSRYPGDYDGVIAGAPAMDWGELMSQHVWTAQIRESAPNLANKFSAITAAVKKACDKNDGVQDGILENPQKCTFDPVVMKCSLFDTNSCLNNAEIAAMRKLYEGPKLTNGELLIPGLAKGSEGGWLMAYILNYLGGGPEYYKWMVYNNSGWTPSNFYLDTDVAQSRARVEPISDSGDPNISAFIQRGGKLIMWHGWADQMIPSANSVRYYEKAQALLGSTLSNSARLFMVPGAQHCQAGFDMVPHLEKWVEQGQAPTQVINTTQALFSTTTHPLCPWPQVAAYNGSGSTTSAASYTCREQP
ncbi:hypothetical protein A4W93_06405 [Piscinibacter gummiphilus]|uniref:Feruloyl esterase n=5 Tax=Piscinibacter gummiphilus TaxID=946333 RepID=A0A1W6L5P0_9BURK|nr:hypothetical protein A4W93_06405 [Piscinibacter gummiphilus]